MPAVVEIDNVTKTFDSLIAVDSINLRVEQGKTLGLIGPNGAGKTTLLRLISSLAKPDRGDIRIHGESVFRNPRGVRKRLGFMPAEFGSPRNLDIGEYLDYFGCMYGVPTPERAQRVKDVCELTDLTGRENVMVKGLSTGNKQRLTVAGQNTTARSRPAHPGRTCKRPRPAGPNRAPWHRACSRVDG